MADGGNTHQTRMQTIQLVDARIEDLKERLRLTYELSQQLGAEIVRLEREKVRYVEQSERPVLLVSRSA